MQDGDGQDEVPGGLADDPGALIEAASTHLRALADRLLSVATLWQLAAILAALAIGWTATRPVLARVRRRLDAPAERSEFRGRIDAALPRVLWPAATVVLLWGTLAAFRAFGLPVDLLRVAASLLNAWIVVRLVAGLASGASATAIAAVPWTIAALHITRLLGPLTEAMRGVVVPLGASRVTLLAIVTGAILAVVAL